MIKLAAFALIVLLREITLQIMFSQVRLTPTGTIKKTDFSSALKVLQEHSGRIPHSFMKTSKNPFKGSTNWPDGGAP